MKSFRQTQIPFLIKLGIIVSVFGLVFPIYGTPSIMGLIRLTCFRLGIILCIWSVWKYRINIFLILKKKLVITILIIFSLRAISLLFSHEYYFGSKQLSWFFQGTIFFILILCFNNKYHNFKELLFRVITFIALLSGLFSIAQYIYFLNGDILALPFSNTSWGGNISRVGSARIFGTFSDTNMMSSFFLFILLLVIPYLFFSEIKSNFFKIILSIASLICVFSSGSKQALFVLASVTFLLYLLTFFRLSFLKNFIFLTIFLGSSSLLFNYIASINPNSIDGFKRGDIIARLVIAKTKQDFSSGRLDYYYKIYNSLDFHTLMFGAGEGSGDWASHNAYLIVLQENGLLCLIMLIVFSFMLIKKTLITTLNCFEYSNSLDISSIFIVVSWILLMASNWAQMNEPFCWMFLGYAVISSDSNFKYKNPIVKHI